MSDSQVTTSKSATRTDAVMTPAVDVVEDKQGITLYADLPGVPKDKLSIQVDADTLTIEGEIALAVTDGLQALHVEVPQPRYRRVFTLSRELDGERIDAQLRNGVLTLHIPKAAHAQPKKIAVAVH